MGIYPDDLKLGKVIPIYNKGQQHTPGNYRPITLLSGFNKIFEKLLHNRIMKYLNENNVICKYQFAFRKLYSTTIALIEITDRIKHLVDDGNYVVGIFLDLTKAFDTVNHQILLDKLHHYGIRGHSNSFFESYLTNRKQYVHINGKSSKIINQNTGVPQGSVLGPLFFLLYINDIYNSINTCDIRLFADDTSLFAHDKNLNLAKEKAQSAYIEIHKWLNCNRLTLNSTKTHFLIFHNKNKYIPDNLNVLECGNHVINRVKSIDYIGLKIDENLTWKHHVDKVTSSLIRYFAIFSKTRLFVNNSLGRQIFYALINSRIRYGIEVYGSCADSYINKLQIIQNKLLKLLMNIEPRYSTNLLHTNLKLLKVKDLHNFASLLFTYECLNKKGPILFHEYFQYKQFHHNMRGSLKLNVPFSKTNTGRKRVNTRMAEEWNKLPANIATLESKGKFKRELKAFLLSKYHE